MRARPFVTRLDDPRSQPWISWTVGTRRRAAAAVEFAVIAPLMVLLVVGMLEVGRAVNVKEILSDSARKGCREASLPTSDNSSVQQAALKVLTNNGISTSNVTLTITVNDLAKDVSTAKTGDKITVQVGIPYSSATWTGAYIMPKSSIGSEAVVMMRQ